MRPASEHEAIPNPRFVVAYPDGEGQKNRQAPYYNRVRIYDAAGGRCCSSYSCRCSELVWEASTDTSYCPASFTYGEDSNVLESRIKPRPLRINHPYYLEVESKGLLFGTSSHGFLEFFIDEHGTVKGGFPDSLFR